MKKLLFSVLVALLFVACDKNPIPNKSIFEELTPEEVTEITSQDKDFEQFYNKLQIPFALIDFSDENKTKFENITYRNLYEFTKESTKKENYTEEELKKIDKDCYEFIKFITDQGTNPFDF